MYFGYSIVFALRVHPIFRARSSRTVLPVRGFLMNSLKFKKNVTGMLAVFKTRHTHKWTFGNQVTLMSRPLDQKRHTHDS